jgi:glycine cleavage system H protein
MRFPENLKYTKDHEWAKIDGRTVTVGITDHAQKELGDVVYIELPTVGRALKKGETFGVVESIKAVSDLYSPVAGKVLEVNKPLTDEPARVNQEPHSGAWLVKIELAEAAAPEDLMDAAAYSKYVETLK